MGKIYSVKQLNQYIKGIFQTDMFLSDVSIRGEVSNLTDHQSGHLYFSLKDEDSNISAVMFRGNRRGLHCVLKNGMKVIVSGNIDIYEASGRVQLYAKEITDDGIGDLQKQFEELKRRLEEMGMFASEYKKPIPKFSLKIGVATSDTGAAIHDIQTITERRNPYVQLYLMPTLVQGEQAPESIIHSIETLDRMGLDVLIVGRGGGSTEDLFCFNDEGVARAIFNANTPIISAVGHEIDFTIADFVADRRAATPSEAAEMAVFDYEEWKRGLDYQEERLRRTVQEKIENYLSDLQKKEIRLQKCHPKHALQEKEMRLMEMETKLHQLMKDLYQNRAQRLALLGEKLHGKSPLEKLKDGFGYIKTTSPVRSVKEVSKGDVIQVQIHDGLLKAEVLEVNDEVVK